MDSELVDFISHLGDDVPFSPYRQLNEMWQELEEYFDRRCFDIDEYLDEILPNAHPVSTMQYDIPSDEPQLMTADELLRSFAIPESFFNDLIVDPPALKDRNRVTDELLLDSVRSQTFCYTGRKYEHPFKEFVSARVNSGVPLRNDCIADSEMTSTPLMSMSSNLEWLSVLHKQHLQLGVTAEVMVKNVLLEKSVILPTQTEVKKVIQMLFKNLNSYIDRLSLEFDDHKFFDTSRLSEIAQKLQQKILSHSNVETKPLLDILLHWMEMITTSFADINDKRREIEEIVSEKIINEAAQIYRRRLMSSDRNESNRSIWYKSESDIICQGIRHAYANCGEVLIARVVSQLEKRLEKEGAAINELRTAPVNSTVSSGIHVIVDLLVSEYASNINQKGLQCAGISTLKQFEDVNVTCLKDIWNNFDRKTSEIPFSERIELKKQLVSKLDSESNSKRLEFKRSLKATVPTAVSSASSLTKSVGIHFGFETITVSYYDRVGNSFRTIYGPIANVVSFSPNGISIGLIPSNSLSLNMEDLLKKLTVVDRTYDTKCHGELKIESIIALMLMYIDQIAKQSLHATSKIQYAIAIPSCLNEVMQSVFKTAIKAANIACKLIREQCALTTNFVRELHPAMSKNKDEFVVAMIVNKKEACDSVVYGIDESMKIKVLSASGAEDNRNSWRWTRDTGVNNELKKIERKCNRRIRFLICGKDQDIFRQIKNKFKEPKVHLLKFDSNRLAEGAALLSYAGYGYSLDCSFDLLNLASIKELSSGGLSYRLNHTTNSPNYQNLPKLSMQLRSIIDNQIKELGECKAATQQIIVGKMKDLEESRLAGREKEKFRQTLTNDLKEVDVELMNQWVVERIAENWKTKQF
ncbi:uncharacterized protein LOC119077370 [Bradysia coprophila]|uniref:uncharacterized protein LOC119077370 n=1 Tax=Bradysia coprophila TaxID=38358 RepID=UPI00187D9F6D|nr:uncharacterized protein LOC119077370 [Bradysia coprophila]